MKKSVKIAFCGVISAVICVVMAASLMPDITFAVPAIAGMFLISVFAETGTGYAFFCFAVSSILSFFISDKTSWLLFVTFFGFYPVIKPVVEKIKKPVYKWTLKLFIFNAAAAVCYLVQYNVLGLKLKIPVVLLLFVIGNCVFAVYDIAVSKLALLYYSKLHGRISGILNK